MMFKNNQEHALNIVANLYMGRSFDDLTDEEIEVLVKEYGLDWKIELGYKESV